jgi:RNA polymerase sigma-70 factor (ECF subfamily)
LDVNRNVLPRLSLMEDRCGVSPDEADFRRVYEQAFPMVYRVAYRFCGRREVAEDAVQEAFARAFERWGRLRGEPWVVGWVVTTALNVLRRAGRRAPELARGSPEHSLPEVETEDVVDLWRAVGELTERQAEAVVLHYIVDLPVAEVAEVMGCREGTAKAHLDRGRRRLATLLEPSEVHKEDR